MGLEIALAGIWGYLVGSIPTGVLLSKLFRGIDVRQHGSGHTGGLNVTRTAGLKAGILTVVIDMLLGAVAVGALTQNPWAAATAGILVVVGHNWSLFLRFGGGIGLSTLGGALLAVSALKTLVTLSLLGLLYFGLIRLLRVHRARATVLVVCLLGPALWVADYALPGILLGVMGGLAVIVKTMPDWNREYPATEGEQQAP